MQARSLGRSKPISKELVNGTIGVIIKSNIEGSIQHYEISQAIKYKGSAQKCTIQILKYQVTIPKIFLERLSFAFFHMQKYRVQKI